mgnify:FL=1
MTDAKGLRLYAVMTDSHRIFDKRVLARKLPEFCGPHDWWTDKADITLWLMPYEAAKKVQSDYGYNNPRIVKECNAIRILEAQGEKT